MLRSTLLFSVAPLALALVVSLPAACAGGAGDDDASGGTATWTTTTGGTGGLGGTGGDATGGLGGGGSGGVPSCATVFRFTPPPGATNVRVPGEWNGFDAATAAAMTGPDGNGVYSATVALAPGLHAYKLLYELGGNANWVLDPEQGRRKYVGGVENSAIEVGDCRLPSLRVESSSVTRPAVGQGRYQAALAFEDGIEGSGPDASALEASLEHDGTSAPLGASALTVDALTGDVSLDVTGLTDGKYRVVLRPHAENGRVGLPLRLVFWVEAETFSWQDALIYMVVTDRYRDGDGQTPPATPGADPRGDFYGGDLEGLRLSIAEGRLDELGVRAIWLTPFQTNPTGAYLASDGVHQVTGYHGYWPVKAREAEPRIGGAAALHALVTTAHAHGIRILQDFVLNHVHQDHEYVAAHPSWFRTGCVCGTSGCDWTAHALDCMFADYLPDVDHTVPEANAAFVDDAVYWLDEYDLDGLRVDAVKHVEEAATRNLAAEVRETFEPAGTRYFLMGETAMGWSDCADPCNDENYDTIAKYVGPLGLDGQFDFVLYHGVTYRTFAYGDAGMIHADYWFSHGLGKWPAGAVMTPYIGSHDTPRFATLSDYRGQDGAHDRGIPGNQWSNTAAAPGDAEPYVRTRVALSWLLGLPGAPLLYYGDEYGQWGGADPNNRAMWRSAGSLSADETATLALTKKLGAARRSVAAMRRGGYLSLATSEDTLVFARPVAPADAAVVVVSRSPAGESLGVDLSALGFAGGTVLHDALGGADLVVPAGGQLTLAVPAYGSAVYAP